MKLPLGEKIREKRTREGMTQEGLAQALGVSSQSVSRWEIGVCYPDIELLPIIANYFGVSLDELMGMDEMRSAEKISAIYSAAFDRERQGDWKGAAAVLRGALEMYPDSDGFMAELACALGQSGESGDLTEAIVLSERVLGRCTQDKLRSTVRANLCFLYKKAGQQDKAEALGRTLPHIWECREMLQPGIADDENRRQMLARSFNIAAQVLRDAAQGREIVFSLGYRPEQDIDPEALIGFAADTE